MSTKLLTLGVVLAILIALFAVFKGNEEKAVFGASADCESTTCLAGGLRITSGVLESDGSFSVPTTDTATSTTMLGCIQTTATSTLTPIRLVIGSNVTASSTYRGSNSVGAVFWQYGTCP